ncbi:MAG: LEA type 2 family protein, partial [Chitinophagaceae bacterium]|nr:LEA type 2 family protein [Chitinophagaceae bacterium]
MKKCLLLLLPIVILLSCKPKGLEYLSFENLQVVKLGFPNSTLKLDVICYNPNKFALSLNALESDVYINQEYLGKAILDSSISVPRKDTFLIPVKLDVKVGGTLTSLLKLISDKSDSTTLLIKLAGKAKLRKGGIAVD